MHDLDTIESLNASKRGGNMSHDAILKFSDLLTKVGMNDELVDQLLARPDFAEKLALILVCAARGLTSSKFQ